MDLNEFFQREPIRDRGISVVMPAHNEADCLEAAVADVAGVLDRLSRGYEIIVVDDGSTDDTALVAQRLADSGRRIRLVRHPTHMGYGAALRSGFLAARYPLLLQLDSDNQYVVGEIERLLGVIDQVDIVCGYRQTRQNGWGLRLCRQWLCSWLARTVFAVRVRDVNCGFKLYRRSLLRRIPIQSSGRFANMEILAKAKFMNMLVGEVEISYRPRQCGVGKRTPELLKQTLREAATVFWRPQFTTTPRAGNEAGSSVKAA